ncbi:MAG: DUF3047 domain-containing protein [Pseudomonadales bacterium]|nr:DUF3047 domain-containing protein [Pseudomonadales bacterium]MCP5213772.1 DUF3047 domain-containing protein [Pseudomonadales bacterium]
MITVPNIFADEQELWVGRFSSGSKAEIFSDWQPYLFETISEHTNYHLVLDQDINVIKATSRAAASGLIRPLDIDLSKYPLLSWRWKVTQRPSGGDDNKRENDDHAARIYLIFNAPEPNESKLKWLWRQLSSNQALNTHALNYIWAHSAKLNQPIPNPYTASVMMIPVNRADVGIGSWIEIKRNVVADYLASFGKQPPRLSGIAIMTDTDNSKSQAIAYYGDIKFIAPDNHTEKTQ